VVVFAIRKWLNGPLFRRLGLLVLLGGLQGFIGWWMVASGIGETDRLDVAPYRLMTHFSLALLIIALTMWTWLDLGAKPQMPPRAGPRKWAVGLLVLLGLQLAAGALVAGLDAGRTYTDWPLMAGEVFPSDYVADGLGIRSLFEGRAATQFNHRLLAYALFVGVLFAWRLYPRQGFGMLALLVSAQSIWGILTLISAAPLGLALVHQGLGVVILLVAVRQLWRVTPSRQTIR
jgi:cytochrome c oxidase assembly protein subunit 15